MRAVIYTRVSSAEQADNGHSLTVQLDKCRSYCVSRGWKEVRHYCDAGISGRRFDNRPELQRMLSDTDYDVIVVASLSRFGRNTREILNSVTSKKGTDFVFLDLQIDTSTPMGKVILTMMSALAELESDQIGIRTKEVIKYRKGNKQSYCGNTPLGYRNNGNGDMVVIPAEMFTVQSIFQMYKDGRTLTNIATTLNRKGLKGKNGGRFAAATIKQIINNPIYANDIREQSE
jgi:site-specific DNA recombinase